MKALEDYWDEYVEYIDDMRDSYEHKRYMLNSDKCFREWVEEKQGKESDSNGYEEDSKESSEKTR